MGLQDHAETHASAQPPMQSFPSHEVLDWYGHVWASLFRSPVILFVGLILGGGVGWGGPCHSVQSANCRAEQEPGQAEALSALSPLDSGERAWVAICFASDSISEYSWLLRFVYSSCFRRGSEDAAGTCASSVCGLSAACLVGSTLRARDGPSNVILLRTGWDKSISSMTLAVQFGCSSVLPQEVAVSPPLEAGLHGLMSVDSESTGTISKWLQVSASVLDRFAEHSSLIRA